MPYKDPAKQIAYAKEDTVSGRNNARAKQWRLDHPEGARRVERACSMRRKIEVLSHYGKGGLLQCSWEGCFVTDVDMLELDHVNNDGAEERRKTGKGTQRFYARLRKNGFPEGYPTLCCNHNRKKEILRRRAGCCVQ